MKFLEDSSFLPGAGLTGWIDPRSVRPVSSKEYLLLAV
jgi:hypothetical protein